MLGTVFLTVWLIIYGYITYSHFEDIVEERSGNGYCGYLICDKGYLKQNVVFAPLSIKVLFIKY